MSKAVIDKPVLDAATIERMEKGASSQGIGQIRRVCLLTMGQSIEKLNQCSKDEPDLFDEFKRAAAEFKNHAQALLEVAESSVLRLAIADEHGDLDAALASIKSGKKGRKA